MEVEKFIIKNKFSIIEKSNYLMFALVFIGLVVIFSYSVGNVSAAGNTVYVNASGGSDTYDGLSAIHTTGTTGPKATIKNGVGTVNTNGTLNIADGQYNGTENTQITINNNMTIKGQSQKGTIINGTGTNYIFGIQSGITVTILNLTITNGSFIGSVQNRGNLTVISSLFTYNNAPGSGSGGAISSVDGNLTVTGCSFTGNNANGVGGAIFSHGNLTVSGSNFNGNTASDGGAILNDNGYTMNVTSSNFTGNNASYGGAIYNGGSLSLTGNTFIGNNATDGGAIMTYDTSNIHFNRIIGNTATNCNDIYNGGTADASLNWWGSNNGPSTGDIQSTVISSPWLVLNITANPVTIGNNAYSTITANLLKSNNGNPVSGYFPNGTAVTFTTTLGAIGSPSNTMNGVIQSTLYSGLAVGIVTVSAILDNQTMTATVTIKDTILPSATANPLGGLYRTAKTVTLNMSEAGTILYTLNGITPTITSTKYTEPITISKTTILKYLAIDLAGNLSPVYSQTYTIDKIPPKVIKTTPTNKKTKISRISNIVIKFRENIKASTYFNKITIKNLTTNKTIKINKIIKGTTLYLKTSKRTANTWYTVTIPRAAIKDRAGNNLTATYSLKFKTGK